jgi:hypothetical protein
MHGSATPTVQNAKPVVSNKLRSSVTLNDSGRRGIRDLPQNIAIPDNILTSFAAALMEACDIEIDDFLFSPAIVTESLRRTKGCSGP